MRRNVTRLLSLSAMVFALAPLTGCEILQQIFECDSESDPTCIDPTRAQIKGTVAIPEAGGASLRAPSSSSQRSARDALVAAVVAEKSGKLGKERRQLDQRKRVPKAGRYDGAAPKKSAERWRQGEVIVRAHEEIRGREAEVTRAVSLILGDTYQVDVGMCGTAYRCLATITDTFGKKIDLETTATIAKRLNAHPFFKYAEKNLILEKAAVFPSDEFFTFQWHYNQIDVPAAWDITTGSPDVVAAIIDTGILVDHPDLANRIVGGADLISDPDTANDGDGRDNDGDDAGDNSCGGGCHSHHGSHVAGTMGAETNNNLMVSGITWEGGLLAVRVLGEGGGSLADIADGIEWSVGNSVSGVRDNPRPADVLNMSLGGTGNSAAMNEAIADAIDAGAIVLVAAGNDNSNASGFTPANAPGAITVSAVGLNAGGIPKRASYSNFGTIVDVAAPGGEQREDSDNDGNGDGVLSTVGDFVAFYQGTSMATPHVAGVAMLMKSVNPNLSQAEALTILQDTADGDITCPEGCGAGNINAFAAVTAASGGDVTGLSAASVRVGKGVTTATITVRNLGDSAVNADFSIGGANRDAVTISPTSASVPAKGKVAITATIARAEGGADVGTVSIRATGGGESAEARLDWTADAGAVVEVVSVGAVKVEDDGSFTVNRIVETNSIGNFAYNLFNVDPGNYLIIGLLDGNNDGDFDDVEDGTGFFSASVDGDGQACTGNGCNQLIAAAGDDLTGIDFLTAPGFNGGDDVGGGGDGDLGGACDSSSDCGSGLYCEVFDGGYCTADCNDSASDCPAGSTCFDIGTDEPYQICFLDCDIDADCGRSDYVCDVFEGIGSCIPE